MGKDKAKAIWTYHIHSVGFKEFSFNSACRLICQGNRNPIRTAEGYISRFSVACLNFTPNPLLYFNIAHYLRLPSLPAMLSLGDTGFGIARHVLSARLCCWNQQTWNQQTPWV